MKLLVVCQYYYPEPFRVSDICESLQAAGHEVLVVTGTPNYPEGEIYPGYEQGKRKDEVVNGVRVHRCPLHPRKQGALHRIWNYYSFVFASRRYLRALQEPFDMVLVNQLSPVMMAEGALMWAKRHKRPCVLYCLDLWPASLTAGGIREGSLLYRIFWIVSRRIYGQADEILVTSKGFIKYLQKTLGLSSSGISYLPQYAEAQFEQIPEWQPHEGPYRMVFAGNIGEMQAVDTILEAARLLEDDRRVQFHIVGEGSDLQRCMGLSANLSNVVFHGRKPLEEMPAIYASADAMLVTLRADEKLEATLPGKVQSYLAAGRTVVGAVDGEAATVIHDAQCGLCAHAEDGRGLADCVRKLVDQPELFAQYGKKARDYYRSTFCKEAFLVKLLEALERYDSEKRANRTNA